MVHEYHAGEEGGDQDTRRDKGNSFDVSPGLRQCSHRDRSRLARVYASFGFRRLDSLIGKAFAQLCSRSPIERLCVYSGSEAP
jgi:hypothetical protein